MLPSISFNSEDFRITRQISNLLFVSEVTLSKGYMMNLHSASKLLADRSLSRLLKNDWPRSIEELEENPAKGGPGQP
jgi:hypothetical protein